MGTQVRHKQEEQHLCHWAFAGLPTSILSWILVHMGSSASSPRAVHCCKIQSIRQGYSSAATGPLFTSPKGNGPPSDYCALPYDWYTGFPLCFKKPMRACSGSPALTGKESFSEDLCWILFNTTGWSCSFSPCDLRALPLLSTKICLVFGKKKIPQTMPNWLFDRKRIWQPISFQQQGWNRSSPWALSQPLAAHSRGGGWHHSAPHASSATLAPRPCSHPLVSAGSQGLVSCPR